MKVSDYDRPRAKKFKRPRRKRLLIVTEGVVTEPTYFRELKSYLNLNANQLDVVVEAGPDYLGNTPMRVVDSAISIKAAAEAAQKRSDDAGNDLESRKEYDVVWVVFDTERHGKNKDLYVAAERAHALGLFSGISRPSFEAWFILHFGVNPSTETCEAICRELSAQTSKSLGRPYRKDSPKNEDLLWLISRILPMTDAALRMSEQIRELAFQKHTLVPSCTASSVDGLVLELLRSSPGYRDRRCDNQNSYVEVLLAEASSMQTDDHAFPHRDLVDYWIAAIRQLVDSGVSLENSAWQLCHTVASMLGTDRCEYQRPSLALAVSEYVASQKTDS